ncbi:MAG: sulfatase [Deltaproteobacteria bacterium]|nr:MAG: sulfatase [Deltaproteobacteria bacterium]
MSRARIPRIVLLLLALLAAIGVGVYRPVWVSVNDLPATRQHVLLLTVDTLRVDALHGAGPGPPATPFVDSLIAEGFWFPRAITPVPRTTPAVASLLTGAYPHTTKVRGLVDPLAPEIVTLAELFRAKGFRTLAVVSNHVLRPNRRLNRGFDVYDYSGDGRDSFATTRAALRHVREQPAGDPIFLWVHYIDPHMPYAPPPELARAFSPDYAGPYRLRFGGEPGSTGPQAFPADLPKRVAIYRNPLSDEVNDHVRRLYAADVRHTDAGIEALVRSLRVERDAGWTIAFTADHGESLGEHAYFFEHGDYVYNPTIRVPLAFVLPRQDPLAGAGRVDDWVSLVDVMPTLAEMFRLPVPVDLAYAIEGRSLVPYLRGERLPSRPVFAESGKSQYPEEVRRRVDFSVAGRFRTVLFGDWKLIWTPGQAPDRAYELYDLAADPAESRDLFEPGRAEAERLERMLASWVRGLDDRTAEPDAHDLAMLRALGYVD